MSLVKKIHNCIKKKFSKPNTRSEVQVMQLTLESLRRPNFEPEEFIQSATATVFKLNNEPTYVHLTALMKVADKMQDIRNILGEPVAITSAYRSFKVNDAVGGSRNSLHCQGLACDFTINNFTPVEIVLALQEAEFDLDKCFVERGCVHIQFQMNDNNNRNFFGSATKVAGEWVVSDKVKAV
jgi:putative chitinase